MKSRSSVLLPVLVCTLAIFLLSAMDAGMKTLVLAIGVYNTVFWRTMLATFVAGVGWMSASRTLPPVSSLRLHGLRALIVGIILVTFFWGLARVPMAVGIGLSFVAPLFALFLAALLLGERIQKIAVWAAVLGFAGVIVILAGQLRGQSYSRDAFAGMMAIFISTVFYGYNLVLTRKQAQLAKPIEIMFFQNLALLFILALFAPWLATSLPRDSWLQIVGVTVLSLSGQYFMSWSYARAEAQYLISTEYSAFIWAIALGWFVFGESVSWPTIAGAGLIILSCWVATRAGSAG